MEIAFYFFGIALLVASVFLMLDAQQNRRVNKLAKETRNIPPLFLQRSAEQKLNRLHSFLCDNSVQGSVLTYSNNVKFNDRTRQNLSSRLNMIIEEHNSGKITLQTYNSRLNDLLSMTRELR